ncbi:iron-containing alcohol dehydrogenase [Enterococcus sp. AZ109]|uniref:iron-containing alcohol dehydrogenase n=1 Tax=Enterococcus sp. AZ109 TaxID=2774634 RepID=UPI003F240823
MEFKVKPTIHSYDSLVEFINDKKLGDKDLIITNEYIIASHISTDQLTCDVLFQEKYGTGEPNDAMIDAMLAEVKKKEYNRIIAIGGGTIIDISKLFVFESNYSCEEIFAQGVNLPKVRELLILPTTCGTGSEVTNISITEFKQKKTKIGLAVEQMYADEAILIGSLLSTIPFPVFATSSIDALIHAIESYVSPKASRFTRAMGREAIEIIIRGYQEITSKATIEVPKDLQHFLEASCMAGIAFGNAGCAAVHALSYPIGAIYHVPHGKANYLVFNAVYQKYLELGADLTPLEEVIQQLFDCSKEEVWQELTKLIDKLLPREKLNTLGIGEKEARDMSQSVIANQQRLLVNNPIPLSEEDIYQVYLECL